MDKKITDFIVTELHIGKWLLAPIDILLFLAAPVFSFLLRQTVCTYKPMEYANYILIVDGLKIASGIFDFLLAILLAIFVYDLTGKKIRAFLTYAITLLLPVLCASCSMWGMGDSIWLFFAMLSVYLLAKEKGNLALLFWAIAVFGHAVYVLVLPVFVLAYMQKKNITLPSFLLVIAGVWFHNGFANQNEKISIPFFEAERLLLYGRGEKLLSYNWPNIYQMIGPDKFVEEYTIVAQCMGMAILFVVAGVCVAKKVQLTKEKMLQLLTMLAIVFAFIMPGMNERNGIFSVLLLLVWAMCRPQLYSIAISQAIITYISFSAFFRGESVLPLSYVAMAELFLLLIVMRTAMTGEYLSITFTSDHS